MKAKTYRLFNFFPEYTVSQWLDLYHTWVGTYYSTPKEKRIGASWESFMGDISTLKTFLKSQKIKFI